MTKERLQSAVKAENTRLLDGRAATRVRPSNELFANAFRLELAYLAPDLSRGEQGALCKSLLDDPSASLDNLTDQESDALEAIFTNGLGRYDASVRAELTDWAQVERGKR